MTGLPLVASSTEERESGADADPDSKENKRNVNRVPMPRHIFALPEAFDD
jgi:hypothetical protein